MSSDRNPIYEALNLAGRFNELLAETKKEESFEAKYWEITALFRLGEVQKSQERLNECKSKFMGIEWQMRCYNLQSIISKNLGDFDTAMEAANQCINLSETIQSVKSTEMRALAFSNIAEIFRIMGRVNKSLEYYFEGYNLFQKNGIKSEIEIFLLNIGIAYRELGRFEEAKGFLEENYRIALNKGNPQYLSYSLVELIELEVRGDINKAEEYISQIKRIYEENKTNKRIGLHYNYGSALVYKYSIRTRDKVKGELLFEELIKNNEIEIYYTLESIPHLIELLLIEYSNYNEPVVLQEIEKKLVLLYNLGNQKRMNKYTIKSLIIQSKLNVIKGQIEDAGMLLDDAEEIAKRYELRLLRSQINDAKENMEQHIYYDRIQPTESDQNSSKFEISGLIDYLKKIQGSLRKN